VAKSLLEENIIRIGIVVVFAFISHGNANMLVKLVVGEKQNSLLKLGLV
jgi:hypothetical protein